MDERKAFQQWLVHLQTQEQIAASHEFDGVRKEKERLTAASLKIEWENDAASMNSRFLMFSWNGEIVTGQHLNSQKE